MSYRSIVFGLLLSISVALLIPARAFGEPVLIKLDLAEPADWSEAQSLGVTAFHRFEGFVLAEYESAELDRLNAAGLKYEVIDEQPWSGEYFLVSRARVPADAVGKIHLDAYGQVLLERAEWQLLKAPGEKVSQLTNLGYNVLPIRRTSIPLEYNPPGVFPRAGVAYSPDIEALLNLVSEDSLYAWVQRLQDFQTRYSYSDSIVAARDWLYQKMAGFGFDSLWLQHYHYDSDQWNVVATIEGTARPDRVIVVGGHYDSVVYGDNDPFVWAPGADDNATGTAYTLELARILVQNPLPVTVMFVPFAQEEQGLVGSFVFAQHLYNQGANVELMVNCDMIGHNPYSTPDVSIFGDPGAAGWVNFMLDMASAYTYLEPHYRGQSSGSDHYSFYQWGYDAVFMYENITTGGYHNGHDIIDSLDFGYMGEIVRLCLAAVLTLGNSPSSVENLRAQDAGDGDAIYLSWSENHPAENVDHYNVYFGTSSGSYDSLHQISGPADTLFNLQTNTTYYIVVAAVNTDGFESISNQEVSIAPRVVPLPPAGLVADPFGTYKIKLDWAASQVADLDYYNVYRSEESGSGYDLLSGAVTDTTLVDSTVQGDVPYYYYTVTAVDTNSNESEMSDEAAGFAVTLDQGILVLDETYEDVAFNMVIGDSVNAFYERALLGYTYAYADHSCPNCYPQNQVRLQEMGRYSAVIVHSEDLRGNRSLGASGDSTYWAVKRYLDYGGKAIIEGRRNLSAGDDGAWTPRGFLPGDVPYDYLKVESAVVPPWSSLYDRTEEFIGAFGQISGYPDLKVDSMRVAQVSSGLELLGRVPGVGYIDSLMAGEILYTFNSVFDTSASDGKPVAFRHLGGDHEVIFFDFPLYFIQEPEATAVLHQALSDLGMYPSSVEDEESGVVASFSLGQNFPNPFNAETIIEYSLPQAGRVEIAVYNILGQRVRTLVDEFQTAGRKRVAWDGRNNRGEEVSSGIYFYRIEAGELTKTKKMLLLR